MRLAHEARRIAAQHGYLDALESTTLRALERGDAAEMVAALRSFEGSLGAHFTLEEKVQFPALHGLDPRLDPELAELVRDHGRFLDQMQAMRAQVDAAGVAHRSQTLFAFGQLASALRQHEEREESILTRAHAEA